MKLILTVWLMCAASFYAFAEADIILFKSHLNQASESEQRLIDAYQSLGLQVEFQTFPFARGIQNAEAGYIDGMLATFSNHNQSDSNLIKIDASFGKIANVLVINNALCQQCGLADLKVVGLMTGNANSPVMDLTASVNIVKFTQFTSLLDFYERNRADAMLLNAASLPSKFKNNPQYTIIALQKRNLYHYLHKKHKHIAEQVQHSLAKMALNKPDKENTIIFTQEDTQLKNSLDYASMPIVKAPDKH